MQELEEERRWEMNLEGLEEGLYDEVSSAAVRVCGPGGILNVAILHHLQKFVYGIYIYIYLFV